MDNALIVRTVYDNFINSIKSEVTRHQYSYLLDRYLKFQKYDTIGDLLQEPKAVEWNIIRYIVWLKDEQKLSAITVNQYVAAIMHFYAINDITLNRKKIGMYVGDYVRANKDRAYTTEEILRLLDFLDERTKALVLLLTSTGMRIGAIPSLAIKHLAKITDYNLYRVTVYEATREEYYCFSTPEAAAAIDTYLDLRVRTGEKLNDNTPFHFPSDFWQKDL